MSSEFDNKLKKISTNTLENAIAKAVSELIGDEFACRISNMSYEGFSDAKLEVKIYKPVDMDFFTTKSNDKAS